MVIKSRLYNLDFNFNITYFKKHKKKNLYQNLNRLILIQQSRLFWVSDYVKNLVVSSPISGGARGLNLNPYVYYALSLTKWASSHDNLNYHLKLKFLQPCWHLINNLNFKWYFNFSNNIEKQITHTTWTFLWSQRKTLREHIPKGIHWP
jgi:hypothetical protein